MLCSQPAESRLLYDGKWERVVRGPVQWPRNLISLFDRGGILS